MLFLNGLKIFLSRYFNLNGSPRLLLVAAWNIPLILYLANCKKNNFKTTVDGLMSFLKDFPKH